jgi:hypothetical protein
VIFFWFGFIIFLLYAAACFLVLNYFLFNTKKSYGVTEKVFTVGNKAVIEEQLKEKPIIKNDTISNKEMKLQNNHTLLADKDKGIFEKKLNAISSSRSIQIEAIATYHKAQPFAVYGSSHATVVAYNLYSVIYKNRANVKIPYECFPYAKEIKKIVANDDKAVLNIIGCSSKEETPSSDEERTEYLRALLLGIGIDANKIKTTGSFQDIEFIEGTAKGGVYMEIKRTNYLALHTLSTAFTYSTKIEVIKSSLSFPFSLKKIVSDDQGYYFYDVQAFTYCINKIKKIYRRSLVKKMEVYALQRLQLMS